MPDWYGYSNEPIKVRQFCGARHISRMNALHDHVCRIEYHEVPDAYHICNCGFNWNLTQEEYQELVNARS